MRINAMLQCLVRVTVAVFLLCTLSLPSGYAAGEADTAKAMVLAARYYNGQGTRVDYPRAFRLYMREAVGGNIEAQFIVGGMLFRGQGTDIDQKTGFQWLLKAAKHGKFSPESLSIIGSMYLQGEGVPQSYQEAVHYLQRAADMGDINAKKNLAYMSYLGMGEEVPDYSKALQMYTDVALQGDDMAQNNVALMHVNGLGTDVDRVLGYAWYSLAASQGNTGAMIARNNLMARMSWEELNRAQAKAVELFEQVGNTIQ